MQNADARVQYWSKVVTSGRDRLNHWRIAYGSAKEVDTFLRPLANAGVVDKRQANFALELFDKLRVMTWRLLHPIS